MRGKLLIASMTVALGLVGFGLGMAAATSHIHDPVNITVREHTATDKVVDVGRKGDSTGDILTFHNKLFNAADTHQVGTDSGQCTRESPGQGTWECWWTATLPDGQITIEGPFFDATGSIEAAVTGGTGRYANARGTMDAVCPDECILHYHLIP